MVVGDDWQSIYSFSGCDVNIFTKFDNFFDVCETRYVEKTYRNSQQLIDASSNFVMKNPDQSRKELKSSKSLECPIKIVKFDNDFDEILKFELIIKNIINQSKFENKKILILGRNNKDIFNLLKNFNVKNEDGKRKFEILGDEDKLRRDKFVKIVYRYNPDVNIEYRTVHQSKGCLLYTSPAPAGVGLVIGDVGKTILNLAGIKDVWSQSFGQTQTTVNFANAIFDALKTLSAVKASEADLKKMGVKY